jgi:hypothetical protein
MGFSCKISLQQIQWLMVILHMNEVWDILRWTGGICWISWWIGEPWRSMLRLLRGRDYMRCSDLEMIFQDREVRWSSLYYYIHMCVCVPVCQLRCILDGQWWTGLNSPIRII